MGLDPSAVTSAVLVSNWTVVESVEDAPAAASQSITSKDFNPSVQRLSPTSDVPVSLFSGDTWTLDGGGAATIDLTDLPGSQGNIDGTGKKVQAIRVQGAEGNGALTISPGASNPYNLFGAGNSVELPAGFLGPMEFRYNDTLDDITDVSGVGSSQIDLAGTAGDEFNIEILLG